MSCGTSGGTTTLCSVPFALLPLGRLGGTTASRFGSQLFVCQQTLLCLKELRLHLLDLDCQSSHSNGLFLYTGSGVPIPGCLFMGSWVPVPGCFLFLGSWVPFPGCFLFLGSWVPFPGCFLFFSLFICSFVSTVANELSTAPHTRAPSSFVLTAAAFSNGLCHPCTLCSLAFFLPFPFVVTRV